MGLSALAADGSEFKRLHRAGGAPTRMPVTLRNARCVAFVDFRTRLPGMSEQYGRACGRAVRRASHVLHQCKDAVGEAGEHALFEQLVPAICRHRSPARGIRRGLTHTLKRNLDDPFRPGASVQKFPCLLG